MQVINGFILLFFFGQLLNCNLSPGSETKSKISFFKYVFLQWIYNFCYAQEISMLHDVGYKHYKNVYILIFGYTALMKIN